MRRHGLVNQPHFLETPHELELQQSKFAWYRDAGALGPDLVFGHFIQTTDEIIVEAAAAGCGMVWQPSSNGRLASGVAERATRRELGMRVGVGLDDQACTDVSDPFMNMRIGIFLQRAHLKDPAAMPVADMLELHTLGSARVLGIDGDVGSLEVGKYADFLVVDPRRPDTGPVWDADRHLRPGLRAAQPRRRLRGRGPGRRPGRPARPGGRRRDLRPGARAAGPHPARRRRR